MASPSNPVNLDGVVNTAAYRAIREHGLLDYLRHENIRYIIDWNDEFILSFFDRFGGGDPRRWLTKIADFPETSPGFEGWHLVVYRVAQHRE